MGDKSRIDYLDATLNFVYGCSKAGMGCTNCYALRQSARLVSMGKYPSDIVDWVGGLKWTGNVHARVNLIEKPFEWKRPRIIGINFMADMFHKNVHDEVINRTIMMCRKAMWHRFVFLTKRARRLIKWQFPANCIVGISASTPHEFEAAWDYALIGGIKRNISMVSLEPLIRPVSFAKFKDDELPDWVIVGGESGHNGRPMHPAWAGDLMAECSERGIPFWFKQWGKWMPYHDEDHAAKPLRMGQLRRLFADGSHTCMPSENLPGSVVMFNRHRVCKDHHQLEGATIRQYPQEIEQWRNWSRENK